MADEIKLKKPGKGRTIIQRRRNATLNSGTRLGNQAAVIAPKTNIVGRSYLTNDYLTQATKKKVHKNPLLAALFLGLSATATGDGTIQPSVVKKQKKLDRDKAKRRSMK
jgi:hypothetical protein|tara:strand:- start:952 stop:1278 length:327 start_codon:yes stop_codon:yes gene_type:complete